MPLTAVAVEPGAHGDAGTGLHGCGVNVPPAAEVAEATAGFSKLVHRPNELMFTGLISATVAIGAVAITAPGATANVEGLNPIEHWSAAPAVTIAGNVSPHPKRGQ
jgi:hypothetical protein